ncbi:site-specific integrase [Mycolicibacterium sp. P9-22]|uniref:tyrosine-type recombinase/integrase n=1 Tax=Mycolicibacterium sp. P9-22 TaxID=2024613 RepID=UPI0011EFCB6A|nr:site-specific integrase [Mycolicibacterium sp. P9-22]KAA0109115.1 site-specific integrase [Mycolicibacterium sp. P9-22]
MRRAGVTIQDLWYSKTNGKPDLSRPTARNGRGRLRYRVAVTDARGRTTSEHFETKKEAVERQRQIAARMSTGGYASRSAGRVCFGEVADLWFDAKTVRLKGKTLEGYRSLLDTHVLPRWATTSVGDIEWNSVQKWVAELTASKPLNRRKGTLSASRVRQAHHVLSAVLGHAVRLQMLASNPAADIDLPRKTTAPRRYLTHEQVALLASECGDFDLLVLVLAYCGLRYGEATALRRENIDFERGRIDVVAAVERVGRQYALGTTKTHTTRSVPVPPQVLARLQERFVASPGRRLVFPGEDGFLKNYEFRRVFDPAAERAGVPGIVPHELRHTCASLAIRTKASIKTVQRMLGHATATMTLDLYGHLYPDELDAVAAAMGAECVYPPRTAGVTQIADQRISAVQ